MIYVKLTPEGKILEETRSNDILPSGYVEMTEEEVRELRAAEYEEDRPHNDRVKKEAWCSQKAAMKFTKEVTRVETQERIDDDGNPISEEVEVVDKVMIPEEELTKEQRDERDLAIKAAAEKYERERKIRPEETHLKKCREDQTKKTRAKAEKIRATAEVRNKHKEALNEAAKIFTDAQVLLRNWAESNALVSRNPDIVESTTAMAFFKKIKVSVGAVGRIANNPNSKEDPSKHIDDARKALGELRHIIG